MKILHINYSELNGGAAIGANRLHQALLKLNINSEMLVVERCTIEPFIHSPKNSVEELIYQLKKILARFIKRKLIRTNNKETFSFNYFNTNILNKIKLINPDIVHIHWIGNEMISISQLKKIKKPIIWTFWDMWPFCGAEHYSYDKRHLNGYSELNRPETEKGLDLNRFIWNYKKKHYEFKFTINAPSKWIYDEIKKSELTKNKSVINIAPNLDTKFWCPFDRDISRQIYQFPKNRKILLFGSSAGVNHRKGFDFLINLFKKKKFDNTKLIIFGEKPKRINELNIEYSFVGQIKDNIALRLLYSSANLLLMPSKLEVFGQVGLESQACGTPCIVFENTGQTDFVKHKETGYVSKLLDVEDFAKGINWILQDENTYNALSNSGIKYVKENFDDDIIGKKFIREYNNVK